MNKEDRANSKSPSKETTRSRSRSPLKKNVYEDQHAQQDQHQESNEQEKLISPTQHDDQKQSRDYGQDQQQQQQQQEEENNPGNNVYVTALSKSTTEATLDETFSRYGKVLKCSIVMDPHLNESRCFGFVTMETPEQAQAAIDALNGFELDGRNLIVQKARRAKPRDSTPGSYRGAPRTRRPDRGGFRGGYRPYHGGPRHGGSGYQQSHHYPAQQPMYQQPYYDPYAYQTMPPQQYAPRPYMPRPTYDQPAPYQFDNNQQGYRPPRRPPVNNRPPPTNYGNIIGQAPYNQMIPQYQYPPNQGNFPPSE